MSAAGLTSSLPFSGDYSDSVILAEGYQMAPGESLISPSQITVTDGLNDALGMTLLRRPDVHRGRWPRVTDGRHGR